MDGIVCVLRTGCQRKTPPRAFGPPGTAHDRFQERARAGVFDRLLEEGLPACAAAATRAQSFNAMKAGRPRQGGRKPV